MSYSDDALKAKLSTLNETQDSIVSVSQWIQFHKRHADKIAAYWLSRLRDSPPPKRLNFVYLVNDIVQNSRARKRAEFPDAFSPLMSDAIEAAYRSSTSDIQNKIRRVVEVWRTRAVFEPSIQDAIESRIDVVDKSKGQTGKKTLMGKSLFESSSTSGMPKELESLGPLQIAVSKANLAARPAIDAAQAEYVKLNDPEVSLPSPPVYAARLSSLIKSLASAESSLASTIDARKKLVTDLEKLLDVNRAALAKDEETYEDLSSRRLSTEAKKREVEDSIIRGLVSTDEAPQVNGDASTSAEFQPARPEFEELTPEPEENGYDPGEPVASTTMPLADNPEVQAALAGFGGYLSPKPLARQHSGEQGISINGSSTKRRKTEHGEDALVPDLGGLGDLVDLNQDVEDLIRQESAATG